MRMSYSCLAGHKCSKLPRKSGHVYHGAMFIGSGSVSIIERIYGGHVAEGSVKVLDGNPWDAG